MFSVLMLRRFPLPIPPIPIPAIFNLSLGAVNPKLLPIIDDGTIVKPAIDVVPTFKNLRLEIFFIFYQFYML